MLDIALLILRIGLGVIFIAHGGQKALGLFGGPGIKGFAGMLSGLGFAPAVFWAYLAAYAELLGGISVLLGLFTRGGAALILIVIVVATFKVHLSKGLFLSKGGFEYNLLIICAAIVLVLMRGGIYTLGRLLKP